MHPVQTPPQSPRSKRPLKVIRKSREEIILKMRTAREHPSSFSPAMSSWWPNWLAAGWHRRPARAAESLSAAERGAQRNDLIPAAHPHQPIPMAPATRHVTNISAAFRLLSTADDLGRQKPEDKLTTALKKEAVDIAHCVLAPTAPQITITRQVASETYVAHPFIRILATSRDTEVFTAPLPSFAFSEIDYPRKALISLHSVVSVWLPGCNGAQIIGFIHGMQPTPSGRILFHIISSSNRFVGYIVGPADLAFPQDREEQAAEYRARRTFEQLATTNPLHTLPKASPNLASVGEFLTTMERSTRPLPIVRRTRSGETFSTPLRPPPSASLPPTPQVESTLHPFNDADSAVHALAPPTAP